MQFSITQKTRPEDAQTAEMELIAAQYRGRARVLQAKLFVQIFLRKKISRNELMIILFIGIMYFILFFLWKMLERFKK